MDTLASDRPTSRNRFGDPPPNRAQRKPSTNPVRGFTPANIRQGGGIIDAGYASGVRKNSNCVKNGSALVRSRYSIFRAASHRPADSAVMIASNMNKGNATICAEGGMW